MMTTIVDYGLGNVYAFLNAFHRLNVSAGLARCAAELERAQRIILPGVGHFDHAMDRLERSGMRDSLDRLVLEERVPVLGVCVGMQLLGHSSEEGRREGLGWIDGVTEAFRPCPGRESLPLPHMGWNDVEPVETNNLFAGIGERPRFYFLHSFRFRCTNPEDVLARTTYGEEFCSALNHRNVYGVQFHPEKSHHFGTGLLKGFAEIPRA